MAGKPTEPVDITGAMVTDPAPLGDWLVIAPVAWCLAVAALLLMVRKNVARQLPIAMVSLVVLVLLDIGLLARVVEQGTLNMTMGRWLPPFGIAFTVDLLGAVFALTTGIVALAAGVFAFGDIEAREMRYGFWSFLFLMVGGVSGAFLTGDIFNLYVWFEVLLIASFGLIILGSETEQIDGATKYTFLNLVATTLFLVGTAFLYGATGTLNMADMAIKLPIAGIEGGAPLLTIAALYLLAFGMKAAAFPVNFWLPASYHTPRIIVAALFAGLLTKVGLYALLRTLLMMMPAARSELGVVIAVIAALTMVTGALGALAQSDMRRLMGYLVISGIGIMLAGLAVASELAMAGTIFYALHSIVTMTALYMATGIAGRITGTFSLHAMGGLYRTSALLAALTLILFFAVSGLPPFTGFWPKAALVRATIEVGAWWLAAAILFNGFVVTIAVGRVFALAYWRPMPGTADDAETSASTDPDALNKDEEVSAEGEEAFVAARRAALAERPGPAIRELAPLGALTALIVLFGLFPEPLFAIASQAGEGLLEPITYFEAVFGSLADPSVDGADAVFPADAEAIVPDSAPDALIVDPLGDGEVEDPEEVMQ